MSCHSWRRLPTARVQISPLITLHSSLCRQIQMVCLATFLLRLECRVNLSVPMSSHSNSSVQLCPSSEFLPTHDFPLGFRVAAFARQHLFGCRRSRIDSDIRLHVVGFQR